MSKETPNKLAGMKKQQFKYVSFYQHDYDDPVLIIFDRKKDAMKDAMESLEESLADCDSGQYPNARTELRRNGATSLDEGDVIFSVMKCEYRSRNPAL